MSTKKQNLFFSNEGNGDSSLCAWRDDGWLNYRRAQERSTSDFPLNIYQVSLKDWKCRENGELCTSEEIAPELACYSKQMGYTHIELLPADLSPQEMAAFVGTLHEAGIGVILDLISRVSDFDWEAEVARCVFEYHADGLCLSCDAIMLGHIHNLMKATCPDVLLLADSALADVRHLSSLFIPQYRQWTENVLCCFACEADLRRGRLDDLFDKDGLESFSHQLLSLSCKDLSCGGSSLLDRMSGDYWQKFASIRALLGYMLTVPGKKRIFMGCEIGEFRAWNEGERMEWFLLDHDAHARLQLFFAQMNWFYLTQPALWNDGAESFQNLSENRGKSVLCYRRVSRDGETLLTVVNLTPAVHHEYEIGVPEGGEYEELINSDHLSFGGSGVINASPIFTESNRFGRFDHTLRITVPPLAVCVFRCRKRNAPEDTIS